MLGIIYLFFVFLNFNSRQFAFIGGSNYFFLAKKKPPPWEDLMEPVLPFRPQWDSFKGLSGMRSVFKYQYFIFTINFSQFDLDYFPFGGGNIFADKIGPDW